MKRIGHHFGFPKTARGKAMLDNVFPKRTQKAVRRRLERLKKDTKQQLAVRQLSENLMLYFYPGKQGNKLLEKCILFDAISPVFDNSIELRSR